MAGNNLSVKITADIVDLQTKFALAKAQVSGLSSELNRLAKASVNGGIDPAGAAQLQQLAGDLVQAKSVASGLSGAMRTAGEGTSMFGRSAEEAGEHSATAVRYVRELFDEISSGRTRYLPSTLAALGQSALHMNFAMLASVGAVGGFIAALVYLGAKAVEASHQLDEVKLGADFAGNLGLSRAAIQQFVDSLSSAANVSSSDARKIATALAEIPGMTETELGAIAPLISQYLQATDQNAAKASESLKKLFEPTETAAAAAKILHVSQSLTDMAQAADRSGNANEVAAAKVKLLEGVLSPMEGDLAKTVEGFKASALWALRWFSATSQGLSPQQANAQIVRENTAAIEAQTAAARARAQALASTPAAQSQTLQLGMTVAQGENPLSSQMEEAKQKISEMTAALAVAKSAGDALEVNALNAGLDTARQKLTELTQQQDKWVTQTTSGLEKMRTEMSSIAQSEFETSSSYLQQLSQAQQQQASQAAQIARINAGADVEISRQRLEATKESLQEEVEATRGAAAQKYAALKQLTSQEAALDIQELQNELSTLKSQPVQYAQVYDQIRELKAKLVTDLAKLDQQEVASARRSAQQDASSWRGGVSEIESSESQMVRSIVSGRQSMSQTLLQLSGNLIEREISDDLRAMTTRVLLAASTQTQQKALEQGGLLYHMLVENQKTTSTAVSQAAQTSATTAGNAARLASTTSTALAAKATSSTLGASTVMADAAKAFSGTYASVAQIPYVGWILAPAAAAAAFAAVAAYQGLASLDVGAWSVPHDMVAQIHKGESVVPTSFAQGLRQTGALGGAAGAGATGASGAGGGDTYQVFISAIDGQSVNRYIQQASPQLRQTLRTLVRGNARAAMA